MKTSSLIDMGEKRESVERAKEKGDVVKVMSQKHDLYSIVLNGHR